MATIAEKRWAMIRDSSRRGQSITRALNAALSEIQEVIHQGTGKFPYVRRYTLIFKDGSKLMLDELHEKVQRRGWPPSGKREHRWVNWWIPESEFTE